MLLKVRFLRNVTRRHGEDGGLLKQSNRSHGGTVGAQSDGVCLPNLLAIYIQSFYPQNSYQESVRYTSVALCAVGTSVTLHNLRPLRDSVCLLYKTFSLSLHISEEPLA